MADNKTNKGTKKSITTQGIINLVVVYFVWSSTYLAIRIAVREGAGFPPFTMAFLRAFTAGTLLILWGWYKKKRLRPTRKEFYILLASGLLLWTGGNGLVTWAEQRAESGLTALIVAGIPIWAAIIDALIDKKKPSGLMIASLFIGFSGIIILTLPTFRSGLEADINSILAIIGASISWSIGSVLQSRNPIELSPQVSSGYQMLSGVIGFGLLIILTNEPKPTPTTEAWFAWGYLVIFGSIIAFTAYITALKLLPTDIVMTYAYVNPVLALLLGWAILQEPITGLTIAGSALVIVGVAGVFQDRRGNPLGH